MIDEQVIVAPLLSLHVQARLLYAVVAVIFKKPWYVDVLAISCGP